MLSTKKTKPTLGTAARKPGGAQTTTHSRTKAGAGVAVMDQAWQAIEREVEDMFAQIDRNLETAASHLASV